MKFKLYSCKLNRLFTVKELENKLCCKFLDDGVEFSMLTDEGYSPLEVVNFTGFCDSEGKEIYENDIVQYIRKQGRIQNGSIGCVKSNKKMGGFEINTHKFGGSITEGTASRLKVIGNTIDNPELII